MFDEAIDNAPRKNQRIMWGSIASSTASSPAQLDFLAMDLSLEWIYLLKINPSSIPNTLMSNGGKKVSRNI